MLVSSLRGKHTCRHSCRLDVVADTRLTVATFWKVHVGEIDVGYDFGESLPMRACEKHDEGVYLMDSRLPLSEADEILGTVLPATKFHTVGGLVLARLRHIPREGEFIVETGYQFTVVEASERTIVKLRVELESAAKQGKKIERIENIENSVCLVP